MDAATLRIILIILGAILLGALYLRERRRIDELTGRRVSRRRSSERARRREPRLSERRSHAGVDEAPSARRRQGVDQDFDGMTPLLEAEQPSTPDEISVSMQGLDLDRPSEGRASRSARAGGDDARGGSEGSLLVQLFVVAIDEVFSGPEIETVAKRLQLLPGKMDIYHRQGRKGQADEPRFSMANLVNPGVFPFDDMDDFSTPGLALFTTFEGLPSDLMVYDELVQTARLLADALGGELRLPDRTPFDDDAWARLRARLLDLINQRTDALG